MSPSELKKLKKSLPKNHLDVLSKNSGFSKTYVWQVLAGERNNNDIIDAAILLANQEKEQAKNRKDAISSL